MSINRIRLDWEKEHCMYVAQKGDIRAYVYGGGIGWQWSVKVAGREGHLWQYNYSRSDSARRGAERFLARLQKSLNRGIHRDNL